MEPLTTTQATDSVLPNRESGSVKERKLSNSSVLLAVVTGLIIIAGAGYGMYRHITHPAALGTLLFSGQSLSGSVVEGGFFGWDEKRIPVQGEINDYAQSGKSAVAIVRKPDTGAQDVQMITPTNTALTADGAGKAALTVSGDGTVVAFAERKDMSIGSEFTAQISAWQVMSIDTVSGARKNFGEGFAPQFFTKNGEKYLLFTTRTGITVINTTTLASRSMVFMNPGLVDYAALVSSDGAYLAVPNGVTQVLDVFSLSLSETDFSVSLLGVAPVAFTHSAFAGNVIKGIVRNEDGSLTLRILDPKQLTASGTAYALPSAPYYRVIK